jgi:predicted NAD/FAD-binding protein
MASWHYLLKMKKIAVIGGGISSLSFILGLCKNLALNKNKIPRIDVY